MSAPESSRAPRLTAVMREGERVTSLELFFDLVFVLALTQCTALMAGTPTWEEMLKGLLLLGVLWWSWVGYAWLTSVVDPEEGSVRLVMFAAMAAFLVAGLCVPRTFGEDALLFALAYGVVRAAHIALFMLASREDVELRRSVLGLAASTALGAGLIVVAAFLDGSVRLGVWGLALVFDTGGPFLFGADGWKLVPSHFAERHGAIIIIALGESIVAIGAGAEAGVDAGVIAAAVLGIAVAGALWWLYFDVVAIVAERRLLKAREGRERNEIARDSYSYLHLPMVAGIALVAVGMRRTLADVGQPLGLVPATAMLGGAAMYLLAHVAFRWRNVRTLNRHRSLCAAALAALLLVEVELKPASLVTLGVLAAVLCLLILYETQRFAEPRDRVRHQLARESVPD
ncbi:MAG TPA: low temperature requirement protein A [Solirubrobacteraceae bacterium]|nr:low temperature requirement protein A [Solirubrobacteraceae bacterium]